MNGNDNRDTDIGSGVLVQSTVVAVDNGAGFAVAETDLTITDRHSGDNYRVEASLNQDFTGAVISTSILVAWKRVYVELEKMYLKGATLGGAGYSGDSDNNPDLVFVDNTTDFSVNDQIEFFTYPSTNQMPVQSKIIAILSTTQLQIQDPGNGYMFPGGSGVKLVGNNNTYEISNSLIQDGYGGATNGADDGVFVEFVWDIDGSGPIPKFTQFPSNNNTMGDILTLWRRSDCDPNTGGVCPNYIQLVAANDIDISASFGLSDPFANFTVLFEDNLKNSNIPASKFSVAQAETIVHEFGHQFGLLVGTLPVVHDDSSMDFPNHENSDQGVMTYDRIYDEGEAEFFIDCLYWIRDLVDGI
jgi:hypothetical protein